MREVIVIYKINLFGYTKRQSYKFKRVVSDWWVSLDGSGKELSQMVLRFDSSKWPVDI